MKIMMAVMSVVAGMVSLVMALMEHVKVNLIAGVFLLPLHTYMYYFIYGCQTESMYTVVNLSLFNRY